ncbi:hypothetical protein CDD83_9435 [Cordyceps sp. RAO-2017]|nr:hypothetical protein CDD83_9435 [Cordyceps sp. RAO-2017]
MATDHKIQFNSVAQEYQMYHQLPMAQLVAELIGKGLGDCNKTRILDLAGGSGHFARQAIDAGAERVDVVDTSMSMMEVGKAIETKLGREGRIHWHCADASLPLWQQGIDILPEGQYDIVMANWLLDHAYSVQDLEGMWQNIAAGLKPGGTFLGVRVTEPGMLGGTGAEGKYGAKLEEFENIPGGVKYRATIQCEPSFAFQAASMEDSYNMTDKIPRKLGITDFEVLAIEDTEVFKKDPEFWKQHQEKPVYTTVMARKR